MMVFAFSESLNCPLSKLIEIGLTEIGLTVLSSFDFVKTFWCFRCITGPGKCIVGSLYCSSIDDGPPCWCQGFSILGLHKFLAIFHTNPDLSDLYNLYLNRKKRIRLSPWLVQYTFCIIPLASSTGMPFSSARYLAALLAFTGFFSIQLPLSSSLHKSPGSFPF